MIVIINIVTIVDHPENVWINSYPANSSATAPPRRLRPAARRAGAGAAGPATAGLQRWERCPSMWVNNG